MAPLKEKLCFSYSVLVLAMVMVLVLVIVIVMFTVVMVHVVTVTAMHGETRLCPEMHANDMHELYETHHKVSPTQNSY